MSIATFPTTATCCCRCNQNGRSVKCKCVTEGRPCLTCLPSRLSKCSNFPPIPPTTTHADDTPPGPAPVSVPSVSMSTQETTSISATQVTIVSNPDSDSFEATTPTTSLPSFHLMNEPNFMWGTVGGTSFTNAINSAYNEAVHWRRNLFQIP